MRFQKLCSEGEEMHHLMRKVQNKKFEQLKSLTNFGKHFAVSPVLPSTGFGIIHSTLLSAATRSNQHPFH
jgi:hypothetical protein